MKKYVCTVCGWVYDPEVEGMLLKTNLMIMFAHSVALAKTNLK